ncbi:TIGR01777 family oxidoreductase [Dysgonomonas macrotermitis]|uniref:TIGR01777 family protein n=1 Tax=Dysgonomonas macrotermitis TaxID=1346286 RepID=A0A1M4SSL4_9BACT|nr:TIGR01777 family oxidoreductase [Dysgonomonas macrotermitis]SHE35176.1 TIGR01777 family protein [Dysgonomonas macrotermitis]
MKIAISGSTGFIGTYLSNYFESRGHTIIPIGRRELSDGHESLLSGILEQADMVVNLAGASINKKWTEAYKQELYSSRIKTTQKIVDAINKSSHKPRLLISASAVGYYHSEGLHNEYEFTKGNGFLSDLCEYWETEAKKVSPEVRLCITRFGVVLASEGGAFKKLAFPAKVGLRAVFGSGKQPFPWIDIADLARSIEYIVYNNEITGTVNLVSPKIISHEEFIRCVSKHYRGILPLRVPACLLQFMMGEMATFLTEGQSVEPKVLNDSRFTFKSRTVSEFCSNLLY